MIDPNKRMLMRLYVSVKRTCALLQEEEDSIDRHLRQGLFEKAARKIWYAIDACVVADEELDEPAAGKLSDHAIRIFYRMLGNSGFIPAHELDLAPRTAIA